MRSKEVENAIKELTEITDLSKEEIQNGDEITAILDAIDLKSLNTVLAYIEELEENNKDYDLIMNRQYEHLKNSVDKQVIRDKIKELEEYQKQVESRMKEKYSERDTLLQVIGGIYYLKSIIGE